MKRILILGALALSQFVIAEFAVASKARVAGLQGARFLKDSQTIFTNPAHINYLGQYLTAEFGDTASGSDPKAEGGLSVRRGSSHGGIYLGHIDATLKRLRDNESYLLPANPLELFWGRGAWGGSVNYSYSNFDTTGKSDRTVGLRLGYAGEKLEVFSSVTLLSKSQRSVNQKFRLKYPAVNLGAEYDFGRRYAFAEVTNAVSVQDITTPVAKKGADVAIRTYEAGVQDRSLSFDDHMIYFGLALKYDQYAENLTTIYNFTSPVVIGFEKIMADWVTLRASITQNVLLGYSRDETLAVPGNYRDSVANNTTVAAGSSFMAKGLEFDGVLEAAGTGTFNSAQLLARVGATYRF